MKKSNSSAGVSARCQFQFSDGRCCRMLRTPAHPFYCPFHARQDRQLIESQRLGTEIAATFHGDFLTATDINHVLGKLFTAVAQDRIAPRKAAVLTYLGQVMLSSLAQVKKEFPFSYKFDHWVKVVDGAPDLSSPELPPGLPEPIASSDGPDETPTPLESALPENTPASPLE